LRRFLYDTAIFIYAMGREHPYREPCRRILGLAGEERLMGEASADLIQELAHQRLRRTGNRHEAITAARTASALCRLHPLEPNDVMHGIDLFQQNPALDARDAVFAALALNRGIDAILATDRAFDEVAGLERIDPADERTIGTLAGRV
jgi:hypothetical protein